MDGYSFLPILRGQPQSRNVVFTQLHRLFSGRGYPTRSIRRDDYGYIANFRADGEFTFTSDAPSGRTFMAMDQAAASSEEIAERVKEELDDFKNDPDGLVNFADNPELREEKEQLKELLYAEMKRSDDPLREEFRNRCLK